MAFNSPNKIPHAKGEQFSKMRNQFCLLAYSVLDEAVCRRELQQDLTELGVTVMRKIAAMDAERTFLRKELANTQSRLQKAESRLEKSEGELEVSRAALDFARDDILELGLENDEQDEEAVKEEIAE